MIQKSSGLEASSFPISYREMVKKNPMDCLWIPFALSIITLSCITLGVAFTFIAIPIVFPSFFFFFSCCSLGIKILFLIKTQKNIQFAKYKQEHTRLPENKKVVFVIESESDKNNVLLENEINIYKQLEEKKYTVFYQKVGANCEIKNSIQELKNKGNQIAAIWINAHGNDRSIYLGKKEREKVLKIEELKESFQSIEKNGVIILSSCDTGKKVAGKLNVAQELARNCPGRKVFAPRTFIGADRIKLGEKDPLNVTMLSTFGKDITETFLVHPN